METTEINEPVKGATILEPVKGYHDKYILDIDASGAYERIFSRRMKKKAGCIKDEWKEFDMIEFMKECITRNTIANDTFREKYNMEIIYGDTNFLHVKVEAENDDKAVEIGKFLSSYIENEWSNFASNVDSSFIDIFGFSDIELRGIADSAYYHGKKRYMIKYIWLYGHKIKCVQLQGIKDIKLIDIVSKVDWSHRRFV